MKLYTAQSMRAIDRAAIEEMGVPSLELMENAARAVVRVLAERFPDGAAGRVIALCGRGNNGGDGLAAARLLKGLGGSAEVLLFAPPDSLTEDAATELERARATEVPVREAPAGDELLRVLSGADLLLDALLGTGARGALEGPLAAAVEAINASGVPVVSVDIPSGLSGDLLAPHGPAVRATLTVTLGFAKPVLFTPEAESFAGEVVVADIGLPADASREVAAAGEALDEAWARPFFVKRAATAHKGECGRVLLAAGSVGKSGAAVLAARGALRAGAGLVTVAVPAPAQPAVAAALPEAMVVPLPATAEGTFSMDALTPLLRLARENDAVGFGPGFGTVAETSALARELYAELDRPAAVDADALNAFAGAAADLGDHDAPRVLTPHPGEMGRLTGLTISQVLVSRYTLVPERAADWSAVVLLKGFRTLVSDGAPPWRMALSGGPHMAAPGMGDVLTGVLAALLARDLDCLEAASLAAWWHGAAADEAFARLGGYGLLASEVADALPAVEGRLRGEAG